MRTATTAIPHLGAFESTKLPGPYIDILGTTHHIEHWASDLEMLCSSGIRELRYPVPWHRVEPRPGGYDWSWMDGPMAHMERCGMNPIVDPIHHVSFPDWMPEGFADPAFPERYAEYVGAFARRYPWVRDYTLFNEPLPTTLFCSLTGLWPPHRTSVEEFVAMSLNVCRATYGAAQAVRRVNPGGRFIHVDTCERHTALDRESSAWTEFANQRRFLLHDLLLGRVTRAHPLYAWLTRHGAPAPELARRAAQPLRFDVLGLDYYAHSELEWRWDRRRGEAVPNWPVRHPVGFAEVAREYAARFTAPLMLTETNIRGSVADRLSWLKFMEEQCETLVAGGGDLRGFCWFPSIDSTDWCHLCLKCTASVDPQGIWWLDAARQTRHPSELSWWYEQLARGLARASDLPAYRFNDRVAEQVAGFMPLMQHWDWREAEAA